MIFGTAGHVDHGKTALVKALTGVDTDRLPEEKKRGITLELGFAQFGEHSVIDVPGHERFVKAMAAGAGGIDVVMLVIAADEGVMPQTREHLDICSLLGVGAGVVVITKADLLPGLGAAWRVMLEADVRELVAGTFLETAPVFEVSAKSLLGLEALKAGLTAVAGGPTREAAGPFFMPIDRAFTIKGFGCVVTGTVRSGHLALSDSVELLPSKHQALRLRGVQVHGQPVEHLGPGQRAAVNVVGVETRDVHRGMALVANGLVPAAKSLDVELTVLATSDHALPKRSRQLLALGTDHVEAVVQLLEADSLKPGQTGFAQLRVARPLAALPGHRFILRGTRAVTGRGATLGGGVVLALNSRRRRPGVTANLQTLAHGDVETRLTWLLTERGQAGLTETELFSHAMASAPALGRALEMAASRGRVVLVDKEHRRWLASTVLENVKQRAMARLEAFHAEFPHRAGLPREALRQRLGLQHEKTFAKVLASLVEANGLEVHGELIRISGRGSTFDAATETLQRRVLSLFAAAGLAPPSLELIASRVGITETQLQAVLRALVAQHALIKAGALYFEAAAVNGLEHRVRSFLATSPTMTTAEFKTLVGQSRKFAIPLAEHFDATHVTLRVGETRTLRKRE